MREDSGEHREQGEENSQPVGDVDEKEVVDMNTALGGEDKFKNDSTGLYLIDVGEILARLLARTSTYPNTDVTPTDANRKK